MKRFRLMLADKFQTIEAESAEEAQDLAFAKTVRELRPEHFECWESGLDDIWGEEQESTA